MCSNKKTSNVSVSVIPNVCCAVHVAVLSQRALVTVLSEKQGKARQTTMLLSRISSPAHSPHTHVGPVADQAPSWVPGFATMIKQVQLAYTRKHMGGSQNSFTCR